MLELMVALTPTSPNLPSTQDKVLAVLSKDIETHIFNDGFQQGVEMYFVPLMRQSTLASDLASIGSNVEA